jgi:hypothetical protein
LNPTFQIGHNGFGSTGPHIVGYDIAGRHYRLSILSGSNSDFRPMSAKRFILLDRRMAFYAAFFWCCTLIIKKSKCSLPASKRLLPVLSGSILLNHPDVHGF